ncbi:MAG: WhiB family transcriptional regulator [Mycobacteriales bacterium]
MASTRTLPAGSRDHRNALIVSIDPDLWFAERPERVAQAQELCRPGPIRSSCLAGAIERLEPWGGSGGELIGDGAVPAHQRGRGRPRKTDIRAAK